MGEGLRPVPENLGSELRMCTHTNRRADAEMVDELRRFARGNGFDEQPMPGLDSEAIDFRAASELSDICKLARRDLETQRLVTDPLRST